MSTELAYLAGFLDGEGCFERAGAAKISVSNTHLPTLEHFQVLYGGSIRSKSSRSDKHRQAYEWSVCGDGARNVCALVFDYLREKQPQAALLMEAISYPKQSEERKGMEQMLKDLKKVEY